MTTPTDDDDLIGLWRSAPAPDVQGLLDDLARLNRLRRGQLFAVAGVVGAVSLLLAITEATGRLTTHGLLSFVWLSTLGFAVLWRLTARRRVADALNLDTRELLRSMIRRAQNGLTFARRIYLGTPLGAVAGYLIASALHINSPVRLPLWDALQTGAGAVLLIAMTGGGLVLARMRRGQIEALTSKLKALDEPL